MLYTDQAMQDYVVELALISAQLDLMNASIDEGLLDTMFVENFGDWSRSPYGTVTLERLRTEALTWQLFTAHILENLCHKILNVDRKDEP